MIEYATASDIGEKEKNEDTVKVFLNQIGLTYGFVLADGLGGHGNGDIASNFVADCVGAAISATDHFDGDFLEECFETAQRLLMEEKETKGYPSIKTTMVVLLITGHIARWGHIGDSRLYHFRDGKLLSRTVDHSVPQMLALRKQIKEREIRHHPDRSALLCALGDEWEDKEYQIDEAKLRVRRGDTFLLCSDGFWEWIDEKTMLKVLRKDASAHESLSEMMSIARESGKGSGMDNFSAILVRLR